MIWTFFFLWPFVIIVKIQGSTLAQMTRPFPWILRFKFYTHHYIFKTNVVVCTGLQSKSNCLSDKNSCTNWKYFDGNSKNASSPSTLFFLFTLWIEILCSCSQESLQRSQWTNRSIFVYILLRLCSAFWLMRAMWTNAIFCYWLKMHSFLL